MKNNLTTRTLPDAEEVVEPGPIVHAYDVDVNEDGSLEDPPLGARSLCGMETVREADQGRWVPITRGEPVRLCQACCVIYPGLRDEAL